MSGLLFDREESSRAGTDSVSGGPLADRMRPRSLDEVEGPDDVVGANGFLSRAIAEDRVPSLVFWGPPGVGKTTLARLIAARTSTRFLAYSAIATGVKEMREVLEASRALRAKAGQGRRSSWTRSTGSTAPSRTSSCLTSRAATSS